MPNNVSKTFHEQLVAALPKLRVRALSLTRNSAAADDLVQDAVCNAIASQKTFIAGTNFPAWIQCILRNRFIATMRKQRNTMDIGDVPEAALATKAPHEDRLVLKELNEALVGLPHDQREALIMVAIHGMSYEELAELTDCAVGTAKSRVFHARRQLDLWMSGDRKNFRKIRLENKTHHFATRKPADLAQTDFGVAVFEGLIPKYC